MTAKQKSSAPDWLFRILQRAGLRVDPGRLPASLKIRFQGSPPIEFHVLTFPVLSLERAHEIVQSSTRRNPRTRFLLAVRQLSERTRAMLRSSGRSWAEELSGVIYIAAPGLLINVSASLHSERSAESAVRARLRDRSGWLAETLLISNPNDRIVLGNIASRSHVSNALASRVLSRLSKLHLTEATGAGPNRTWRLADRGGLLDLWAAEERQRPEKTYGLYVWSRTLPALLQKLPTLNRLTQAWALGGAAAANLYAPTLTTYPDPAIWVDARIPPEEIARALHGEIVEKGANIQLWQSERNLPLELGTFQLPKERRPAAHGRGLRLVSRPRAYIEAVHAAGRSPEIAQNLRERILSGNESD